MLSPIILLAGVRSRFEFQPGLEPLAADATKQPETWTVRTKYEAGRR